jgi:galactoside O-acetyltransferase
MKSSDNIFFDLSALKFLGPHAIVGKTVRVRKPERVSIGEHSIIDDFTYISCALALGRYSHVGANSVLIGGDGRIAIGDFVNIAPGCRLICASNDYAGGGLVGPAIPAEYAGKSITADVRLEDHVLLGAGTVILPGVRVPEGVSTGALTLITEKTKLEPWTLYAGTPARPRRRRESKAILDAAARLMAGKGGTPA